MTSGFLINLAGFTAAALVFAAFYMRTMLPLRLAAIGSNLAFIVYGALAQLYPILLLHALLLPLNIYRLYQIRDILRRIRSAQSPETLVQSITPLLARETFSKDSMIFRKGDAAVKMYVLLSGTILLPEIGVTLQEGTIFGEAGLFSDAHQRMASAQCMSDVVAGSLTKLDLETAFLQNPELSSTLLRLLSTRLVEDIASLEARLAEG